MFCHSKAYHRWKEFVENRQRQRDMVWRALSRMGKSMMGGGFRTWHENTVKAALYAQTNQLYEDLRRQKEAYTEQIIHRAIKRMQNQCLSSCFNLLHANAKHEREQKIAVQRTLARWVKRSLFNTFSSWAHYSQTRHRHRRVVVKILARVENQGLAAAIGKWRSFVMQDARMRIEKERLISVIKKISH